MNALKILLIEPGADEIHKTLGISSERCEELMNYLTKLTTEDNQVTEIMVKCSEKAVHVNELAFLLFTFGGYLEHIRRQNLTLIAIQDVNEENPEE